MSSDQRQPGSWHRNVRIAVEGLLNRVEFLEDACGVSRKGMHNRLAQLEELAGIKSGRAGAGGKCFANSRGRIWIGGVSGTLSGEGMTIAEAEQRQRELEAETRAAWAAQAARRSSNVHQLRRAG